MLVTKFMFHSQGTRTQLLLPILWLIYKHTTYMKKGCLILMGFFFEEEVELETSFWIIILDVMQPWVVYIINSFSSPTLTCINVCMNAVTFFLFVVYVTKKKPT